MPQEAVDEVVTGLTEGEERCPGPKWAPDLLPPPQNSGSAVSRSNGYRTKLLQEPTGSGCPRGCWELQFPNQYPHPQLLLQSLYVADISQFFKSHKKNLEEPCKRMGAWTTGSKTEQAGVQIEVGENWEFGILSLREEGLMAGFGKRRESVRGLDFWV